MDINRSHKLVDAAAPARVTQTPTDNHGGAVQPLYLVIHYTAGVNYQGAVQHFLKPEAKASAHLVIGRNGEIVQMVNFNLIAWHAGASAWGDLTMLNRYSIGIELANAGYLKRTAEGNWITYTGKIIPPGEVILATHKNQQREVGWQIFPQAQLDALEEVATALHSKYQFRDILGHDDIAPMRKVDPGPAFPTDGFRSRVLGRSDD